MCRHKDQTCTTICDYTAGLIPALAGYMLSQKEHTGKSFLLLSSQTHTGDGRVLRLTVNGGSVAQDK